MGSTHNDNKLVPATQATTKRQQARVTGDSVFGHTLSPAGGLTSFPRTYPGLADSPWATCFCPLRGLTSFPSHLPQGSRTLPGLHAFAHCVGLRHSPRTYPGLADSPRATCFCPLRRLTSFPSHLPRARGLSLGYMLLPTAWAYVIPLALTQGSRT